MISRKDFDDELNEIYSKANGKPKFSEEKVLELCLKHKSLSSGKNWKKLACMLGFDESEGEKLRKWTLRQQKKLEIKLEDLSPAEEFAAEEASGTENTAEIFQKLYKEKTQIRDTFNAYRRELREDSRIDRMRDTIKETVALLNILPSYQYIPSVPSKSTSEAIMMLSDLHIGVNCNNFYNKYNIKIAKQRVDKYVEKVIKYCLANNVRRLTVLNLGDDIHGIIHTNARVQQETDAVTQTMVAAEIIAEALNKLTKAAPEVYYKSCSDNHSRMSPNKEESIQEESLGRFVDWMLQERLKDKSILFVEDNLDHSLGKFTLLNGKKVVFSHGHLDSRNQAFQNYIGATREFIDYILLSHWHNSQIKGFQGSKVFINGSVVGTEDYALSKRLFSDPEQLLLIFKDEDLIVQFISLK